MRAERATLKPHRDDMIITPGKRSAARGYGPPLFGEMSREDQTWHKFFEMTLQKEK